MIYFQFAEAWWQHTWMPLPEDVATRATLGAFVRRTRAALRAGFDGFLTSLGRHMNGRAARRTLFVWGTANANFCSHRKAEALMAEVGLPLALEMARQWPGRFAVLDRIHSSELRPEESNDGTHFGNGFGRLVDDGASAGRRTAPKPCSCPSGAQCVQTCCRECRLLTDAAAPDDAARGRTSGGGTGSTLLSYSQRRAGVGLAEVKDVAGGAWPFGPVAYERDVVLTHAHMLLSVVAENGRAMWAGGP